MEALHDQILELPEQPEQPVRHVTIGTLLAGIRRQRGLRKVDMAKALDVQHQNISGFEAGAASDALAMGYIRKLAVSNDELEEIADRLGGNVTADIYDKRIPPLERVMVNDRYQRAGRDGYAKRARDLAREKCPAEDSNPGSCSHCGHLLLTAIDGRGRGSGPFDQLPLFPPRSE